MAIDFDKNLGQQVARYWHTLVEGDTESPEQRMYLGFLFYAALGCLVGAMLNYLFNITAIFLIVILAVVGSGFLAAWAYFRRGREAKGAIPVVCCIVVLMLLPLNWFYNQGMQGPSLLLFLTVAGYAFCVLLSNPWQRALLALLFLVTPYMLIWLSHASPDLIDPYPSRTAQAIDFAFTYSICIALMLAMVSGFFRRFYREQRLINDYAERLQESVRRDSLTGLLNHGAFYALVDEHCTGADGRADVNAALILYDLDHFKIVNDTYGHVYGDRTLQYFAQVLRDVVDPRGGIAGRCGGEEFAVFLPYYAQHEVEEVDAALRSICERTPLEHGTVRFSGGISLKRADSVEQWMEYADRALYAGKCRGRSRTVFGPFALREQESPG